MEKRRPSLRLVRGSEQPRDSHVARALAAMKAEPSRRWTVAALGRAAALSRAALARRFKHAIGVSPLRWLAEHRLGLAQSQLLETDRSLAVIAAEVGYQCEFAFAKAFKRIVGIAPGAFRRQARTHRVASGAPMFRAAA